VEEVTISVEWVAGAKRGDEHLVVVDCRPAERGVVDNPMSDVDAKAFGRRATVV